MAAPRSIDHGYAQPAAPKAKAKRERAPKRANGTGSIKWDPVRKCHRIAVSIPGTSSRRTGRARTQREAAQVLARLQQEVAGLAPAAPRPRGRGGARGWTLAQWLDEWSKEGGIGSDRDGRYGTGLSKASIRREAWQLRVLRDGLGHVSLYALDGRTINDFLADRATRKVERAKWSRETCSNVRNFLAFVLDPAIRNGLAPHPNAARDAALPGNAKRSRAKFATTAPNAKRLLDAARAQETTVYGVIALQLATGMRPGEARTLQWGGVDLESGTASVTHAKTPTGVRTIKLPPQGIAVLRDRARAAQLAVRDPAAYVFPGKRARRVSEEWLIDTLADLCDELAITVDPKAPRALLPHELRHTVGSILLDSEIDGRRMADADVAELLGHDVATLRRVYDHQLQPEVGASAVAHFDAMYGAAAS
jgi:integrase